MEKKRVYKLQLAYMLHVINDILMLKPRFAVDFAKSESFREI